MTNPLTAARITRPATLDIRSAAASRNEKATDIEAAEPPPDYATVVRERDHALKLLEKVYAAYARLRDQSPVYIEDAIEARTPLVSLKQGDYRRDIFPRDVIGGGR